MPTAVAPCPEKAKLAEAAATVFRRKRQTQQPQSRHTLPARSRDFVGFRVAPVLRGVFPLHEPAHRFAHLKMIVIQ